MPTAAEIVSSLGEISRSWPALAVWWHIYFGGVIVALLAGFRPSRRLFGMLMVPPLVSVSVLAWLASNPFNGSVFAVAAIALATVAVRSEANKVRSAPWPFVVAGSLLFAFGWLYPHFTAPASLLTHLYAPPLGLIPCPTLSVIVGLTVMFRGLESVGWSSVLALVGIFYGIYGAVVLGVTIDWVLVVGSLGAVLAVHASRTQVRS